MKESYRLTHINRINHGSPNGSGNSYKKIRVQYLVTTKKNDFITYHPERNCTPNAKIFAKLKSRRVWVPKTAHVALSNEDPATGQNPVAKDVVSKLRDPQSGR